MVNNSCSPLTIAQRAQKRNGSNALDRHAVIVGIPPIHRFQTRERELVLFRSFRSFLVVEGGQRWQMLVQRWHTLARVRYSFHMTHLRRVIVPDAKTVRRGRRYILARYQEYNVK